MAVTPEDVEKLEGLLERNRAALSRGEAVMPISIGMQSPIQPQRKQLKIFDAKEIKGKKVGLVMTAEELAVSNGEETYVRRLRIEQIRPGGIQCSSVTFELLPALFRETGVFLPAPQGRGKQRFRSSELQKFDPWLAFDGSPAAKKAIKGLRVLGVSFFR